VNVLELLLVLLLQLEFKIPKLVIIKWKLIQRINSKATPLVGGIVGNGTPGGWT
jgi:hypothetical protein